MSEAWREDDEAQALWELARTRRPVRAEEWADLYRRALDDQDAPIEPLLEMDPEFAKLAAAAAAQGESAPAPRLRRRALAVLSRARSGNVAAEVGGGAGWPRRVRNWSAAAAGLAACASLGLWAGRSVAHAEGGRQGAASPTLLALDEVGLELDSFVSLKGSGR
jgi:hypothetical protein